MDTDGVVKIRVMSIVFIDAIKVCYHLPQIHLWLFIVVIHDGMTEQKGLPLRWHAIWHLLCGLLFQQR